MEHVLIVLFGAVLAGVITAIFSLTVSWFFSIWVIYLVVIYGGIIITDGDLNLFD